MHTVVGQSPRQIDERRDEMPVPPKKSYRSANKTKASHFLLYSASIGMAKTHHEQYRPIRVQFDMGR